MVKCVLGVAGLGVHGFELFGFRALEGVELSGSGFVCGGSGY